MMASAFKECNITIVVQGETTGWNAPGKAALLFGSHSRGFEPVVLMALAGSLHRYDWHETPYLSATQANLSLK
jgi:hypothetical protein